MSATIARCEACHALVDPEDLFCGNCGREVPGATGDGAGRLDIEAKNFGCRSCGASMNYDAKARALKCPFCGSVDLAAEGGHGILAPEVVLPFAFDGDEARRRLREWLGSGFWHPSDLRTEARLDAPTAVYVPCWVFATRVSTHWAADTSETPGFSRSGWAPIAGHANRVYADLWVPASSGVPADELNAILPFDSSRGVPPEEVDLAGVTVEQFRITRRHARPRAQGLLEALERQAVAGAVPGRSRNVHVNVLMEDSTSRPALAPVYILAYRYRDRLFRYVLNGQSGKATGTAPTSLAKVGWIVGIVLAVLLVILLFGALVVR